MEGKYNNWLFLKKLEFTQLENTPIWQEDVVDEAMKISDDKDDGHMEDVRSGAARRRTE